VTLQYRIPHSLLIAFCTVCCIGHAQQNAVVRSTTRVYRIYLDRGGCQPAVLKPATGSFVLSVVNLTGPRDLNLVLHPSGTNVTNSITAIATKALSPAQRKWNFQVSLAAGSYLLEEATSTEHHCSIVIP
jgi:hypothetical protein